jgi:hypothetical protein
VILSASFVAMTLLLLLVFYRGTGSNKRVLAFSVAWIAIVAGLAAAGFFENTGTMPPRFLIVLVGNVLMVLLTLAHLKKIEIRASSAWMIHAMRIPVELTLYLLYHRQLVPKIMTFAGLNFDILIGISALLFLLLSRLSDWRPYRRLLLFWNYAGLLFLVHIVLIAVLSAPLPIQIMSFDQPNIAVTQFPYVLLPAFIVPVVLMTHILSLRQLHKSQ